MTTRLADKVASLTGIDQAVSRRLAGRFEVGEFRREFDRRNGRVTGGTLHAGEVKAYLQLVLAMAAKALTSWLREAIGVSTVVASIHPDNIASQTVARRAGLRPTDRLRLPRPIRRPFDPGR